MLTAVYCFCVAIGTIFIQNVNAHIATITDWKYADAPKWGNKYPKCKGTRQSPLDIDYEKTVFVKAETEPFRHYRTNNTEDFFLENNGYTVKLKLPHVRHVLYQPVKDGECIAFTQMHWHWGVNSSIGSEHSIDGKFFPLEGHLLGYNCRFYSSLKAAAQKPGGLLVYTILYSLTAADDKDAQFFNIIADKLPNLMNQNSTEKISSFDLKKLLPTERQNFYRYEGSVSKPGCQENVLWTIFEGTVGITENQLNKFRKLKFHDGKPMVNNFRPQQLLSSKRIDSAPRIISRNFNRDTPKPDLLRSIVVTFSVIVVVTLMLCVLYKMVSIVMDTYP